MKLFSKISIGILIGAGLALLLLPAGWFPSFYDVHYMGYAALVEALFIHYLPKLLKVPVNILEANKKNQAADLFQFLLALIFLMGALGDLGLYQLYKIGFQYDKVLHFFMPLFSVVVISIVLRNHLMIPPFYCTLIALFVVIGFGISWEFFEYLVDNFFKTHIYGVYGSDIMNDTEFDLLFDGIGAFSGAVYVTSFLKTS